MCHTLVLSRKANEVVVITLEDGRQLFVTLVEIRGDKCRLGFKADDSIQIHRGEVQAAIEGTNVKEVSLAAWRKKNGKVVTP